MPLQNEKGWHVVRDLLQRNDWLVSIDLKDAYLSIQIAEGDRKFYVCFLWKEKTYEFWCLLFGLSSAPRVFTKLLKSVMALLRRQGIRTIIFLVHNGTIKGRAGQPSGRNPTILATLGVCHQPREICALLKSHHSTL